MHSVNDREGLLPKCSVDYLELTETTEVEDMHMLAADHQWQVTHRQYKFCLITTVVEVASDKAHG